MADVELFHFRKARHRRNVLIIQSVAGVQFDSGARGCGGGGLEQIELAVALTARRGQRVTTGVKLDRRRAQFCGGFDLLEIGIDEQRDMDARVATASPGRPSPTSRFLAGDVQAPFGCQFKAEVLGDKRGLMGFQVESQRNDRRLEGQLEIQAHLYGLFEQSDVAVLDVAAVFAEMDGDDVGASELGKYGSPDGVGFTPSSRLAKRGDMIDVDAEAWHPVISPSAEDVYTGRSRRAVALGSPWVGAQGGSADGSQGGLGEDKSSRRANGKLTRPFRSEPRPRQAAS